MGYNLALTRKGKNKLVLVYKNEDCLFVCFFGVGQHLTSRMKWNCLVDKEGEFSRLTKELVDNKVELDVKGVLLCLH